MMSLNKENEFVCLNRVQYTPISIAMKKIESSVEFEQIYLDRQAFYLDHNEVSCFSKTSPRLDQSF